MQLTGVLTGCYWVFTATIGVLTGYYGVLTGYYGGTQVSRIGAEGGARRGTRLDAHGLPVWARELLRSHARSALGTPPSARGCSSGTDYFVRGLVSRSRPRAALTCGQRARMRRVFGCSDPDHTSANNGANEGAVVGWYSATAGSVAWLCTCAHGHGHAKRRRRASPQGRTLAFAMHGVQRECLARSHDVFIAHDWVRCDDCCRPRPCLVQPAMRGVRMGAISARQAISRSSTRRRARRRPRQPARPTSAV